MPPKQKALDKKEKLESERTDRARAELEKREAAEWSIGAKDDSKAKKQEEAEMLKQQKAAEKSALIAAEESDLAKVVVKKKAAKKDQGDLALLNKALAEAPKTPAQKAAELKKKQDEERKKEEEQKRLAKEERMKAEDAERKKNLARGIVMNHTDDLMVPLNNRLEEDDFEDASGLEAAIDLMTVVPKSKGKHDEHPEKKQKAMYNAYYEVELPKMKSEHPGLKLSQYKERIFNNWQSSPQNPKNTVFAFKAASAAAADDDYDNA